MRLGGHRRIGIAGLRYTRQRASAQLRRAEEDCFEPDIAMDVLSAQPCSGQ
jgi:hypothetical protein